MFGWKVRPFLTLLFFQEINEEKYSNHTRQEKKYRPMKSNVILLNLVRDFMRITVYALE